MAVKRIETAKQGTRETAHGGNAFEGENLPHSSAAGARSGDGC